jgi:6-phosphogluconolactonase
MHGMKPSLLTLVVVLWIAAVAQAAPEGAAAKAGKVRLYVGTYTSGESKGIYRLQLDLATGALAAAGDPTETVSPSFLAFHPNGRFLYAVNETGDARSDPSGGVSAFAIDAATGALTFLNRQPSGGAAPCHLSVDALGRHLLVANYWGGNVEVLPIQPDGRLGPQVALVQHEGTNPTPRDAGPHAHSVDLDTANRFAFVSDLGLDKLFVYAFDPVQGTLKAHTPPSVALAKGAGPRHFTFDRRERFAYAINELNSTVTVFAYDAKAGTLAEVESVPTLPAGVKVANSTAEIAVRPDGKFLYASNRGHDSLAIFAVHPETGRLTASGHQPTLGKAPRHFAIDPSGSYLLAANQNSDSIVVFRIDAAKGTLEPVGKPFRVPKPVCLLMTTAH